MPLFPAHFCVGLVVLALHPPSPPSPPPSPSQPVALTPLTPLPLTLTGAGSTGGSRAEGVRAGRLGWRVAIEICAQGVSPVRVEDCAAIVICTQRVLCARSRSGPAIVICSVRVRGSAAVVICDRVRCSRAFGIALPLGFTGNVRTVRVIGGLVRVQDGAAIVSHRQRVDCARVGDGAAVVICSQDAVHVMHDGCVVSCRVMSPGVVSRHVISGRVMMRCCTVSCRVMSHHLIWSCHVMSCHVMSCHVMSCHVMPCHVTSRHDTSCHVTSRYVASCHVMSCHVMSRRVMPCHAVSCRVMLRHCPVALRRVASRRAATTH